MEKEDLSLFLGMLCGDGHLCIRTKKQGYKNYSTEFCNTNINIINLFDNLFYKIFKVKGNFHSRKREDRKEIFEFRSYSKEVFDKISELGFPIGVKRDNLRIPKIVKDGSKEEKLSFLLGVFVTDGALKNKRMFFHTGSKIFLEEVSSLIYELIGTKKEVKTYLQKEKFLSYQLSLNKEESREILSKPPSHNGIASVLSFKI